jgi:Tol biopolymer transport system component
VFNSGGDPRTKNDVWVLPFIGERKPIPVAQTEFNELMGSFSPDGRWVVYQSDETGRMEIYAQLLDGSGGKIRISANGARRPMWRTDGEIFFSSMDRKLHVANIRTTASSLEVKNVTSLFDYESRSIVPNWVDDVSYDGKQFLAIVTESKQTSVPITLVVNWNEETKKK